MVVTILNHTTQHYDFSSASAKARASWLPKVTSVSRGASQNALQLVRLSPGLLLIKITIGTVKANDVFTISLVTKTEDGPPKSIASFQPKWTYPIFGEEETIYGYQGLKINLRFNASDMRPHFSHTKSQTVPADVADQDPTDIKEDVEPFLPQGTCTSPLTVLSRD